MNLLSNIPKKVKYLFGTGLLAFTLQIQAVELPISPTNISPKEDTLSAFMKDYVPEVHIDIIKDRLACMQSQDGVRMTYHADVLRWIKFYTLKRRSYTKKVLERSTFYFPIFEEALKRHNMPDELKHLAIVESALRPEAISIAGAGGLWQFMPATGKEYGLYQDAYIDERMDIYKATDSACRFLKFLYNYFKDWQLALAAYNCGPGNVNRAIRLAGGKHVSFWTIYQYLPRETRAYVPAFIGATYSFHYSAEHNIFPENPIPALDIESIEVNRYVHIDELARQIGVEPELLRQLNPHLRKKVVPYYGKSVQIYIPSNKKDYLAKNRASILEDAYMATRRDMPFTGGDNQLSIGNNHTKITHILKEGETLQWVALKYNVSVSNLKVWNKLHKVNLQNNQKITVWLEDKISMGNHTK